MKYLFVYFFSLTLAITSVLQSEQMDVASEQCEFDGKKLSLSGNISIVHELGKMTAENAILYPNPEEPKLSLGILKLFRNVAITSKSGSRLTCDKASFDFVALLGDFLSEDPDSFVTFQEGLNGKAGTPLRLKSRSMQAQIDRNKSKNQNAQTIKKITASKDVEITYKDLTANGDKSIFQKSLEVDIPLQASSSKQMPGTITLSMDREEDLCTLSSIKGHRINTPSLTIDTITKEVFFSMPKGKVPIQQNPVESNLIFSADHLLWKLNSDQLCLSENVDVEIENQGTLKTNEELVILYHQVNGKRELRSIESCGLTLLTSPEKKSGDFHHLYCFGTLHLDNEKLTISFESPKDEQGKVFIDNQVIFRDSLGEMHSDALIIHYQHLAGKVVPSRMVAEGNVYLLDRKGTPANENAPLLHYALSDKAEYEFDSKEVLFSSVQKNRVLFYDKINNLQISAPALKIKRDNSNNKESIHGIGDVRFSFLEKESEKLKERFKSLPHRY